ncbi:hypothetical protein SEA_ZIGGYZOO_32 [Gordonia phage ZiggyZoo]|nr:hypothetical protein SEA_ZIGGYZOO_32 [Gordonia phage ZiggyZoo]
MRHDLLVTAHNPDLVWYTFTLVGCQAKIERASEHIDELRGGLRGWASAQSLQEPYLSYESASQMWLWRAPELAQPPARFGAIFGDVVQNLRSCLDQLASGLVHSAGNEVTTAVKYPICHDIDEWNKRAHRCLPGVAGASLEAVREYQPFTNHPELGVLASISNVEKHRFAPPVSALQTSATTADLQWLHPPAARVVHLARVGGDATLHGHPVIAEARFDPPDVTPPPLMIPLSLAISFGLDDAGVGAVYLANLEQMRDSVAGLLSRFGERPADQA